MADNNESTSRVYDIIKSLKNNSPLSFHPFENVIIATNILKARYASPLADTLSDFVSNTMEMFTAKSLSSVKPKLVIDTTDVKQVVDLYTKDNNDYRFLFIRECDIDSFSGFIDLDESGEVTYIGKYGDLEVYCTDYIDSVYLLSDPIMDVNNISVMYNDTTGCEIEDGDKFDGHKMFLSYNTVLGNIDIIRINTTTI